MAEELTAKLRAYLCTRLAWLAAIVLVSAASAQAVVHPRVAACNHQYLERLLLNQQALELSIDLVPGAEVDYPTASRYFRGVKRLEDVFLNIAPDTASEKLAAFEQELVDGGAQERARVLIKRRLRQGRPISLRELLPPSPRRLTGTFATGDPDLSGPNCFNATMMWFDATEPAQFVGTSVISDFLEHRTRRLGVGESLRFGDIIVFSSRGRLDDLRIEHTAVYIGDGIVWHKASRLPQDPWTFEKLDSVVELYFEESLAYSAQPPYELEFYRYKRQVAFRQSAQTR